MRSQFSMVDFFDQIFSNSVFDLPSNFGEVWTESNFPPANIWVDDSTKNLHFEFSVAGYSEENIKLEFSGDYMILRLTNSNDKNEDKRYWIRNQLKKSSYTGKYYIPISKYDVENVKATIKDGILTVDIPAGKALKPREIKLISK